ncbi:MAG: undecaprenyl-phosphate glucose phosphotransferase, partial [Muribaculaceae bacterium]|nr:undecaprenyl-phosphate glucose phosphotransferase [Muribaculaceae bacterium]
MESKGRYGQFIRWIFIAIDFIVLNASYVATCLLTDIQHQPFYGKPIWLMLNLSFLAVVYVLSTLHDKRVVYIDRVLMLLVKYMLLHAVIFLMLLSLVDESVSWKTLALFYTIFALTLATWWIVSRKLLKWYRSKGFNYRKIVIIGGGTSGAGMRLMQQLKEDEGYGYHIVGFFDDEPVNDLDAYRGGVNELESFIEKNSIDEIYCAIPENDRQELQHIINIAERNAIDFYYVPQFSKYISRRFEVETFGTVPVMSIHPHPLQNPFNKAIKRGFDLLVSSVVLLFSPIVFLPIAIGVKLSSPGPVFFRQERTGYRGKSFQCLKFRSMRVNDKSDSLQATKDDPRKTKFGNFIRKTSLDELPQFINVFKGDMSIVGPRPHMVQQTQEYSELIDKYMLRHTIKPGITGWAQVNGFRGPTDELWKMEKRVELDVWYAENWNFMLDIKIMFLTVFNAIRG